MISMEFILYHLDLILERIKIGYLQPSLIVSISLPFENQLFYSEIVTKSCNVTQWNEALTLDTTENWISLTASGLLVFQLTLRNSPILHFSFFTIPKHLQNSFLLNFVRDILTLKYSRLPSQFFHTNFTIFSNSLNCKILRNTIFTIIVSVLSEELLVTNFLVKKGNFILNHNSTIFLSVNFVIDRTHPSLELTLQPAILPPFPTPYNLD